MIGRLTLALLILVVGMVGWALWRQSEQRAPTLPEIVEALRHDKVNLSITNTWSEAMSTMTTTWKSAKGNHSVVTTRREGESEEAWAARHAAELEAQQAQFPPVP